MQHFVWFRPDNTLDREYNNNNIETLPAEDLITGNRAIIFTLRAFAPYTSRKF